MTDREVFFYVCGVHGTIYPKVMTEKGDLVGDCPGIDPIQGVAFTHSPIVGKLDITGRWKPEDAKSVDK